MKCYLISFNNILKCTCLFFYFESLQFPIFDSSLLILRPFLQEFNNPFKLPNLHSVLSFHVVNARVELALDVPRMAVLASYEHSHRLNFIVQPLYLLFLRNEESPVVHFLPSQLLLHEQDPLISRQQVALQLLDLAPSLVQILLPQPGQLRVVLELLLQQLHVLGFILQGVL